MSHLSKVLNALSRLLSYPDEHTLSATEFLFVTLQGELPEAASEVSKLGAYLEQHELWEVEEAYTRMFDINPTCALEVGWHLFGEEYARGMFLVRMREEMRKYGQAESAELPDHISHVLSLVAVMPADEAERFVRACVQPAVEKMLESLAGRESPYESAIACLSLVFKHTWGEPSEDDSSTVPQTGAFEGDPLRAYPVADVGSGCESMCCGGPEVVQIDPRIPTQNSLTPRENRD